MKRKYKTIIYTVMVIAVVAVMLIFKDSLLGLARAFQENAMAFVSMSRNGISQNLFETRFRFLILISTAATFCLLIILLFLFIKLYRTTKSLYRTNHNLENLNKSVKTFLDADPNYVYLKDENLKYMFVNKALNNLLSPPYNDKTLGQDDITPFGEMAPKKFFETDLEVLAQNSPMIEEIIWDDRVYSCKKFPISMLNGKIGVGAYIMDITRESRQDQLKERVHKRHHLVLEMQNRSFKSGQDQLDYALGKILELTGSQYGYIYLYDEKTKRFVISSWTKEVKGDCAVKNPQDTYLLDNTGIWGEVVRQRKPIVINDFNKPDPLKKGMPNGHVALKRFMSIPIFADDKIVAVVGLGNKEEPYTNFDVNELTLAMAGVWSSLQRRESAEKLSYERNKYYQTLLSIGDGVMVIDSNRNIEFINPVASDLTGWAYRDALGLNYRDVFTISYEEEITTRDPIERAFKTGEPQALESQAILTSKGGAVYYIENSTAPIFEDSGQIAGVVLTFRDITEKTKDLKRIQYMSFHDPLTGLYNRRFFEEELGRIDTERNLPISILIGDTNGLKLTNDVFGHNFGDILLKKVAKVMKDTCRADDIIARWGGDEFVLLLPKTNLDEAKGICRRIKREISAQQVRAIKCSISIGYDTKVRPSDDIKKILSNAEVKMYSIKALEHDARKEMEFTSITNALYSSSNDEKRHSLLVKRMCRKLGAALGLSSIEIGKLAEAGRLHDIGKIVLKPSLLAKEHPLNPKDQNEMDKHPVVGFRILSYFDETLELAESVLAHHENWDGSGYPKGLKGKDIPLFARIISIIETYERISNVKGSADQKENHRKAVEIIKRNMGSRFDPDIAKVFLETFHADEDRQYAINPSGTSS